MHSPAPAPVGSDENKTQGRTPGMLIKHVLILLSVEAAGNVFFKYLVINY